MHQFLTNRLLFILLFQAFLVTCCIERERQALLKFKGSVSDPSNRLATWRGDECCKWAGVRCSNQTGHVIKLYLPNSINHSLHGEINHALSFLSDLKHLDLSHNNFSGNKFPNFISSLRNLNYLNLSSTGLSGMIPPQLGNLSKLRYLDLSYLPDTFVSNVWWLSHLSSLRHLDMSEVYFRDSKEWVQAMSMLPLLRTLILEGNGLTTIPSSINPANFSSLQVLIIQDNCFNTRMPGWIGKLTNLKKLWLWYSCFIDQIPMQFGNLASLNSLLLADERLKGPMPPLHNLKNLTRLYIEDVNTGGETIRGFMSKLADDCFDKLKVLHLVNLSLTGNLTGWLSKMPNLNRLNLGSNYLNGTVPSDVGNLTLLENFILEKNSFTGYVSEIHLAGLSRLKYLSLRLNSIAITVDRNWIPPFQLKRLFLGGCKLGPHFPSWLQNQSHLMEVGLSNTGIINTIPDWFWNFSSLSFVILSENNISGRLPFSLEHLTQLNRLLLQKNLFVGTIPTLPNSLEFVNFSENFFHGTVNNLTCRLDSLTILDLGKNNLSGNLPLCWPSMLEVVNMANNKLSGCIPSSMGILSSLQILQLSNNAFTSELPSTLAFCRNLNVLDIGENKLSGQIPEWIGKNLKHLNVLRLRSNMFSGEIPVQIMHLADLYFLDLASNHISGLIPGDLVLLHAMSSSSGNNTDLVSVNFHIDFSLVNGIDFILSELVVTKNLEQLYTTNLPLFKSIDLSGNHLTGEIPWQIITLMGLINLNLLNNHLHGSIPTQIGQMKSLESLDLSMNELSGMIPQSLTNLNFLSALDLSYNNLSGKIPTGNQLQTLDNPLIYTGNDYLCGYPLNKSCDTSENPIRYVAMVSYDSEDVLLYLYVVLGFLLGFLVICGILFFKERWRYCFFRVVDDGFDKLCVFFVMRGYLNSLHVSLTGGSIQSVPTGDGANINFSLDG